ncbi:MAG: hypothetical protein RI907_3590 [Pseudomonadota bacterium]|jgi:plasmid stability protein
MASLTIRNLDDDLKARLRLRAAQHGLSMEEELRTILRQVLTPRAVEGVSLGQRVHERFAAVHQQHGGGDDWAPPARQPVRPPPQFD